MASDQISQEDLKRSIQEAEEDLRLAEGIYGLEHEQIAKRLERYSVLLKLDFRMEEATAVEQRVLKIREKCAGISIEIVPADEEKENESSPALKQLIEIGNRLFSERKFAEAESMYREALENNLGGNLSDRDRQLILIGLARTCRKLYEVREAGDIYVQALDVSAKYRADESSIVKEYSDFLDGIECLALSCNACYIFKQRGQKLCRVCQRDFLNDSNSKSFVIARKLRPKHILKLAKISVGLSVGITTPAVVVVVSNGHSYYISSVVSIGICIGIFSFVTFLVESIIGSFLPTPPEPLKREKEIRPKGTPLFDAGRLTGKEQLSTVKVLGGDLAQGIWKFTGHSLVLPMTDGSYGQNVQLHGQIREITVASEKSTKDQKGALIGVLAGSALAGPLGGAIGYMVAGSSKELTILCSLSDGRKFLANMDQRIYQRMLLL